MARTIPGISSSILLVLGIRRSKRPQHICIILRGLPGSGKSSIAKKLREIEVELGGEPPRLHALDDYFVTVRPTPCLCLDDVCSPLSTLGVTSDGCMSVVLCCMKGIRSLEEG